MAYTRGEYIKARNQNDLPFRFRAGDPVPEGSRGPPKSRIKKSEASARELEIEPARFHSSIFFYYLLSSIFLPSLQIRSNDHDTISFIFLPSKRKVFSLDIREKSVLSRNSSRVILSRERDSISRIGGCVSIRKRKEKEEEKERERKKTF